MPATAAKIIRRVGCGILVGIVIGTLLALRRGFRGPAYFGITVIGAVVVCVVIAVLFGERFIEHL